jgi:hypothetical protein
MTPGHPGDGQRSPPERTEATDRLERVGGARRLVPAPTTQQRGHRCAVEPQQSDQDGRGHAHGTRRTRWAARLKTCTNSWKSTASAPGIGRTTTSTPPSTAAARHAARSLRRMRFRSTASPTERPTARPKRLGASRSQRPRASTITPAALNARPSVRTRSKSARRRSELPRSTPGASSASSSGQPGPALGPPPSQDGAPCPRLHARPEAVCPLPATVVWLEGTFGHGVPSSVRGPTQAIRAVIAK